MLGDEIIDGVFCRVISGFSIDKKAIIKVWFSPNFNYRIKKVSVTTTDALMISYVSFKKYESELWFPQKILNEFYYKNEDNGEWIIESKSILYIHDDYKINIKIPEEIFGIKFPKGISVYDKRMNYQFIVE